MICQLQQYCSISATNQMTGVLTLSKQRLFHGLTLTAAIMPTQFKCKTNIPRIMCSDTFEKVLRSMTKSPKHWSGLQTSKPAECSCEEKELLTGQRPTSQDPKIHCQCPGAKNDRIPSVVVCPCHDRSELFWHHERDQNNIRLAVLLLWLVNIWSTRIWLFCQSFCLKI